MRMINHDEAIQLESIIRSVYNCNRFGVMGIADADHLENHPMDAALAIFSPCYLSEKEIPDIDNFIDRFSCIFNFPDGYEYNEQTIKNYIKELKQLKVKYCNFK